MTARLIFEVPPQAKLLLLFFHLWQNLFIRRSVFFQDGGAGLSLHSAQTMCKITPSASLFLHVDHPLLFPEWAVSARASCMQAFILNESKDGRRLRGGEWRTRTCIENPIEKAYQAGSYLNLLTELTDTGKSFYLHFSTSL